MVRAQTGDFIFSIDIDPAFGNALSVVIKQENHTDSIDFLIRKDFRDSSGNYHLKKPIPELQLIELTNCLSKYQFEVRGNDEVTSQHLNINGRDSIVNLHKVMTDGAVTSGEFIREGNSSKFQFYFVHEEDKRLLVLLFDILHKTFKDKESVKYINGFKGEALN